MASLTQPMPYSYYPSSGSVQHTRKRPPDDEGGRGSFGPVLLVLAVISFLSVAACIAGRLRGRRSSSKAKSSSEQQTTADAEKGFGTMSHPAVMRPLPSSRATVHDVDDDDVFEIKLAAVKPAGSSDKGGAGGGGVGRAPALPQPPQLGLPRQCAPPGFRCVPAPANGGGVARQVHPQVRAGPAINGMSFTPAKQTR